MSNLPNCERRKRDLGFLGNGRSGFLLIGRSGFLLIGRSNLREMCDRAISC
ncbi:hypothetical protein QUB08_26385 [Microcoleus sp. BR0-C5]|uniref:hypothetical protein n=1 Tax=Microcoleus sp. BR0-C5 TaxID=2818713 RepID=UPI002FD0BB8F